MRDGLSGDSPRALSSPSPLLAAAPQCVETLCEYADALDKSTAPEAVGGGTTRRLCRSISGDQMAMHRQKISMIKDAVRKAKASYRDAQLVRPAPRARTRRTALPRARARRCGTHRPRLLRLDAG